MPSAHTVTLAAAGTREAETVRGASALQKPAPQSRAVQHSCEQPAARIKGVSRMGSQWGEDTGVLQAMMLGHGPSILAVQDRSASWSWDQ